MSETLSNFYFSMQSICSLALLIFYPLSRIITNFAIFLIFSWEPIPGMSGSVGILADPHGLTGVSPGGLENEEILQYLLMR
jgi:hypothetical protein